MLKQKNPLRLFFAIPDHPWADEGAAVRISMTGGELENLKVVQIAQLGLVLSEKAGGTPEESADRVDLKWLSTGQIFGNFTAGANVSDSILLKSNQGLACLGVKLHGMGFCVDAAEAKNIESDVVFPYINGRDLLQNTRNALVIDCLV